MFTLAFLLLGTGRKERCTEMGTNVDCLVGASWVTFGDFGGDGGRDIFEESVLVGLVDENLVGAGRLTESLGLED